MMTPGSANALLLADAGYQIQRSVRLRSSASAYFSRTPASAGNRKTWTWSGWGKRGSLGSTQIFFSANQNSGSDTDHSDIRFTSGDKILFYTDVGGSGASNLTTTQVFRDPSAWYHIVIALDTTQSTASNRVKLYVNGTQITAFDTATYPSQNADFFVNAAINHRIGNYQPNNLPFDGYLTDINFIDGQALTPASFGEINPVTGVWAAKKYAGTYGTNGFFLNFSDNSAATAAAIGKDSSGNGNNWTPSGVSVTAGVTYDSMLDVPLGAGGPERGNYAVVNPLSKGTSQTSVIDGNLYAIPISGGSNWGTVFSSIAIPTSGKWYMEATAQLYAGSGNSSSFGVVDSSAFIPTNSAILYTFTTGEGFDGILAHLFNDYVSPISDGVQGTNVTGLTASSINLMLAIDVDNGKVYAGYNGTWLNSGNPVGGTGEVAARTFSANDVVAGHTSWNGTNDQSQYYNFGQRPFAYTPPTGFKALHTGNLPEPVIKKPEQYMAATLYTGNGYPTAGTQSITNTVNGVSLQPDLVWIKRRDAAATHVLTDSARGVNSQLFSNQTAAQETNTDHVTAFTSSGFGLGTGTSGIYPSTNNNGASYIAWQWKEGATPGFDIVTYTGTGVGRTVAHSLGVAPKMIIVKNRTGIARNWAVYHASLPIANGLLLDATGAAAAYGFWNGAAPTSSVFSLSGDLTVNTSGDTLVAYCFSEVAGYSKFGSYTGNGSADGPFVFCGFRPRFVMVKRTDSTGNWYLIDTARSASNLAANVLAPNLSAAEPAFTTEFNEDILSNGFKLRVANVESNANGGTYIFMAFAEHPFKNSLAR